MRTTDTIQHETFRPRFTSSLYELRDSGLGSARLRVLVSNRGINADAAPHGRFERVGTIGICGVAHDPICPGCVGRKDHLLAWLHWSATRSHWLPPLHLDTRPLFGRSRP